MKKVLIAMLLISSMVSVGCKDSIILDENTLAQQKDVQNFEITEMPVDLNGNFTAFNYVDDKVIGFKVVHEDKEYNLEEVIINEEGKFIEDEKYLISGETFNDTIFCGAEGITQEYDTEKQGDEREFYYRDNLNDITIRLDGFNELIKNYKDGYYKEGRKLSNSQKYYVISLNKYDISLKEDFNSGINQQIIILDIEHEKMYYKNEARIINSNNIDISNSDNERVISLYYDEGINSIMAITYSGKVKKVILEGNNIEFEDYKVLNLQGYKLYNNGVVEIMQLSDKKFILTLEDSENTGYVYAVYDYTSGELNILEKDIQDVYTLGKNNLFTVKYNQEAYLAQLKEDYSVEFIYKFSKDNYKCINAYGVMNGNGDKVFIKKYIYTGEDINKGYDDSDIEVEHSFLELYNK